MFFLEVKSCKNFFGNIHEKLFYRITRVRVSSIEYCFALESKNKKKLRFNTMSTHEYYKECFYYYYHCKSFLFLIYDHWICWGWPENVISIIYAKVIFVECGQQCRCVVLFTPSLSRRPILRSHILILMFHVNHLKAKSRFNNKA